MQYGGYWQRSGGRRLSRRRTLAGLAGGAGAAAFLAACGGSEDKQESGGASTSGGQAASGTQGAQEQPRAGGVVSFPTATDPPNLDIHQVTTYTGVWPVAPALNQLVQFDPDKPTDTQKDIIADLATKWEQVDQTTMVFTLKPGVKFHDGGDFTAEDVTTQLEWIKKPPQGKTSPRAGALATVDAIETPDPMTVRLKTSRPTASLLMNLSSHYFAIGQAKDIVANGGMGPNVIGTGPFKWKRYERSNFIELEKNPAYHVQGRPYLDGVKAYIIPDFTTRLTNFLAGQYHLIYGEVRPSDQDRMRQELGNKVVTPQVPSYTRDFVFPNARRKPYDDPRVRQAISLAIDRDAAIQVVREGAGFRGAYMSPKGEWALPEAELRKFDGYDKPNIEKAKQLLSAAGVTGTLEASGTTRTDFKDFAEFVKDQLSKINIRLNLTLADTATAQPVLQRSDFDIGPWTVSINIDDPDATFSEVSTSNAVRNWSGVKDPKIDELYDKQSQTFDASERKKLVNEMEKQAMSTFQVICLYFHNLTFGRYASVRNFVEHESLYTNRRMEGAWLRT